VLKISDFGFVKVNENLEMQSRSGKKSRFMAESLVGSINYMAPDILLSEI
jgi:serine/threonine protein kinase